MNRADFDTQPNGFPLESDATLGFMQNDYHSAIRALAKSIGVQNAILTGVEIANGVATDGWILYDGDVVFFQGGSVGSHFLITESSVSKANQNGQIVPRYFTKVAQFGNGANEVNFNLLVRLTDVRSLATVLNNVANGGVNAVGEWVILWGLESNVNGISSGVALYGNLIVEVASYTGTVNESNPIYLTSDGEWTTVALANHLKFEPRTNRRLESLQKKSQAAIGEIRWVVSSELDLTFFPVNGFGKWDFDGWKIADGTFGTLDLSNAIAGLTALQRI